VRRYRKRQQSRDALLRCSIWGSCAVRAKACDFERRSGGAVMQQGRKTRSCGCAEPPEIRCIALQLGCTRTCRKKAECALLRRCCRIFYVFQSFLSLKQTSLLEHSQGPLSIELSYRSGCFGKGNYCSRTKTNWYRSNSHYLLEGTNLGSRFLNAHS